MSCLEDVDQRLLTAFNAEKHIRLAYIGILRAGRNGPCSEEHDREHAMYPLHMFISSPGILAGRASLSLPFCIIYRTGMPKPPMIHVRNIISHVDLSEIPLYIFC